MIASPAIAGSRHDIGGTVHSLYGLGLLLLTCGDLLVLSSARPASGLRSTTPLHSINPQDNYLPSVLTATDAVFFTTAPTESPSDSPSSLPSSMPSDIPSGTPTASPTLWPTALPSDSPSNIPTPAPTVSAAPTEKPTPASDVWPENPVPSSPPSQYFNYDTRTTAEYGPGYPEKEFHNATYDKTVYRNNKWADVNVGRYSDNMWLEFHEDYGWGPLQGALENRDVDVNKCGRIGRQSPIDVRSTGAFCNENHQIRPRKGDWLIDDDENITKKILPNKLQLFYARRPCKTCAEPDPPHADFPYFWRGGADVTHIDIKAPAEHLIEGRRYDAEYQIFHVHQGKRLMAAVSVMIEVNSTTEENKHFQKALDQFQEEYDADSEACAESQRNRRRLITRVRRMLGFEDKTADIDYSTWDQFSTYSDERGNIRGSNRKLPKQDGPSSGTPGAWDPYHDSIVKTIYFWGYEGSTTDPPCHEAVSWRILDTPFQISLDQLQQIKRLIFTHVDEDCNPTSVHYEGSVARPLQDVLDRDVYRCLRRNFKSDEEYEQIREDRRTPSAAPSVSPAPSPPPNTATSPAPSSPAPSSPALSSPAPSSPALSSPAPSSPAPTMLSTGVPSLGPSDL